MESERSRLRIAAVAALAAGLLLRLWFVLHAPVVSGDSLVYGAIARNWMTQGIFGFYTDANGALVPTLIRLPGYPLLLAACFRVFGMENYVAVRLVQVVLDLLSCWLAGSTASRMFGTRAGTATLWLAALCPFTANYTAAPLSETAVLFTIAAALYGFVRWQDAGGELNVWLWLVAPALAYSLLLRPEQVLLSAVVLPAMIPCGRRTGANLRQALQPVVLCAICVVLPLVPWTVRNWRTFHVFQPLAPRYANDPGEQAPLDFARWYRTWALEFASTDAVYWNYNGDSISPASLPSRAFDGGSPAATATLHQETLELLALYNTTRQQTPAIEASFAALAKQRIAAHPVEYYLLLPVGRLANMILRPRTEMMAIPDEWWRWHPQPAKCLFALSYAGLNLLYLTVGAAGFLRWRREGFNGHREVAWAMAGTILLRCVLLLTIDNSEPRYTLEFFPVIFICAGALFRRASRADDALAAHN